MPERKRFVFQVEGSIAPGTPWFRPRDGGRYTTKIEAIEMVPHYRVPGVSLGIRVRRIDLDKEREQALRRRTIADPVVVAAPILRKREQK